MHKLDFDSMYTNIPFGKVKQVIMVFYHLISKETSVPLDVFLDALSFFIEDDSYFAYNDSIFRQCKGLQMGSKLSTILTEIFVAFGLNNAFLVLQNEKITFLSIFIDDLIAGLHKDYITDLHVCISKHCNGIALKLSHEDVIGEVFYYNMAISRDIEDDNKIRCRRWLKPLSCRRILDFNSFHPNAMKKNLAKEYVRNALLVTSYCYWKR